MISEPVKLSDPITSNKKYRWKRSGKEKKVSTNKKLDGTGIPEKLGERCIAKAYPAALPGGRKQGGLMNKYR